MPAAPDLFPFDNSYARLPENLYARVTPTPVLAPRLLRVNEGLAAALGLDPTALASPDGIAVLAGNRVPLGAQPLAMAYAGHQFGHFSPQLGDGRALLLGEIVDAAGQRHDLHFKGSGRTPFSRSGDGRAAVGPVLREYLMGEAMAALGIPTTRVLAAVATGERIMRETVLPGAILLRVAHSHLRVGTFEFFSARQDVDALRVLVDHAVARHQPDAVGAANPALALLDGVVARTAQLVARWQAVGFIHGVMNTDNMSISGQTLDYGPCAFMDTYHPGTVFSSIDHHGRYAYGNQPAMAHWNMTRLARALLPLLGESPSAALEAAQAAVDRFPALFDEANLTLLRKKLGLLKARPEDDALAADFLACLAEQQVDFTLAFRRLSDVTAVTGKSNDAAVHGLFAAPQAFDAWAKAWRARLTHEDTTPEQRRTSMRAVNPAFIPRNHRVEAALVAASRHGDMQLFETLLAVLAAPYEDQPHHAAYENPPQPHEVVPATFCGT